MLAAIDMQNGHMQWTKPMNGPPELILGDVGNHTFFLCSSDFSIATQQTLQLMLLDVQTGATRWQSNTTVKGATAQHTLACGGGQDQVYAENSQGNSTLVTAYQLQTGKELWQRQWPGTITAIDANGLYVTTWYSDQPFTSPRTLTAINASDGTPRWHISGEYSALLFGDQLPTVANVLLMRTQDSLIGMDARSGQIVWQRHISLSMSNIYPALHGDGDVIYYEDFETLYALHAATGAIIWQKPVPLGPAVPQLIYTTQQLYLLLPNRAVIAFNLANGDIRWQTSNIASLAG